MAAVASGGNQFYLYQSPLLCVQESSCRRAAGRKTDVFSNNKMKRNQNKFKKVTAWFPHSILIFTLLFKHFVPV